MTDPRFEGSIPADLGQPCATAIQSWFDQATGVGLVRRSASEPLRWIAENAGEQGYVVVSEVADLPDGHGLNAATGEYGDLMAASVIDPVKVTRSALQNAASIAAMLLTTEALVVEKKEAAPESATTLLRSSRVGMSPPCRPRTGHPTRRKARGPSTHAPRTGR